MYNSILSLEEFYLKNLFFSRYLHFLFSFHQVIYKEPNNLYPNHLIENEEHLYSIQAIFFFSIAILNLLSFYLSVEKEKYLYKE